MPVVPPMGHREHKAGNCMSDQEEIKELSRQVDLLKVPHSMIYQRLVLLAKGGGKPLTYREAGEH
jgi:hypothetical protein